MGFGGIRDRIGSEWIEGIGFLGLVNTGHQGWMGTNIHSLHTSSVENVSATQSNRHLLNIISFRKTPCAHGQLELLLSR